MRKNSINFVGLILVMLGVILDLILNWKNHIKIIENKVTKKLSLTHQAGDLLKKQLLINIYHSYTSCYLNYAIIAWGNTRITKF